MLRVVIYYALLMSVVAYAFRRGGWPERAAALTILVGSVLTQVALSPFAGRFGGVEFSVLLVDLAALAAFVALALKSDRYWPIWIAAFQLIGVLAHLARMADPTMMRTGYAVILALWSYPMLALIAIGTWRHHRRTRITRRS
jgi:hypothetical protein